MRQRERDRWMELLEAERESHRKERQELLNRLARPQFTVVDPEPNREVKPPSKDDQELRFVGQSVPFGVAVGSNREPA